MRRLLRVWALILVATLAACTHAPQRLGSAIYVPTAPGSGPLTFGPTNSTSGITQSAATSDVATTNLVLTPQAPWPSAVTNLTPGNLLINIPAELGSAAPGNLQVQRGGTTYVQLGQYVHGAGLGAVWFAGQTGSNTYALASDGTTTTYLNGPSGGAVDLLIAGTAVAILNGASMQMAVPLGGNSSLPFAWGTNASAIAIGAGGTFTLTGAQAANPVTALSGSLGTNAAVVVVPNLAGHYEFDLSGLTSSTGTLQFKSGTATTTALAVGTPGSTLTSMASLVVCDSRGSNTIACRF